jgi:hypothetical protein
MSYFYRDYTVTKPVNQGSASNGTTSTNTSYITYYVNNKNGAEYRTAPAPNGEAKGTYKYADKVEIIKGSELTANGSVWVRMKDNKWIAKSNLSTTKPSTVEYVTYYVNINEGLNYRTTPNGTLKGELKNGTKVEVIKGSDKTVNGLVWV